MVSMESMGEGLYLANDSVPVEVFRLRGLFYAYYPSGEVYQVCDGDAENRPDNSIPSRFLSPVSLEKVLTMTEKTLETAQRNYNFVHLLARKSKAP